MMLKTAMLVSALAISAPALAQDMTPTAQTEKKAKKAKKAPVEATTPETATTTDPAATPQEVPAPTTAQSDPIPGAPVTEPAPVPAEQATAPAPMTTPETAPVAQAQTPTTPQTAPAAPATAPAETAAARADPATAPAQTATAAPADPAAPVTGATQIAQVVNTEFPTYDKNADTNLDKTEFSAWMVALKTASDPATKATDPATVTWINGAFASADADKSAMVSKEELTRYLSQGAE